MRWWMLARQILKDLYWAIVAILVLLMLLTIFEDIRNSVRNRIGGINIYKEVGTWLQH